jgi:hypothetical protein
MTQDEQIKLLAEQGFRPPRIASMIGMNANVVRQKLKDMKIEPGFIKQTKIPYGLTRQSYKLRAQLGQIITDLSTKYEQGAVSSLTGLNRREISHAMRHPYSHDWKLSQIERTLDCEGLSIHDIT